MKFTRFTGFATKHQVCVSVVLIIFIPSQTNAAILDTMVEDATAHIIIYSGISTCNLWVSSWLK